MRKPELVRFEIEGAEVAVRLAGDREKPALLLIHGFPSSSESFRNVIGTLARDCFLITPDLPGFGGSEPVERPSFSRFADMIDGLLARLGAGSFHLYLHDYGAAVGLHLATRAPRRIRSLIVQNANAHESGMGPQWSATRAYWDDPTPEREAEATAHLTFEGTRDQYMGDVPRDIAERIDPRLWEEDWRIMSLPGRLDTQRALVLDYRSHFARFGEIADYLDRWQPPALMLWGRHDSFFDLEETLSWMKALPRMEAHILDGPHFLLETHPAECAALMSASSGARRGCVRTFVYRRRNVAGRTGPATQDSSPFSVETGGFLARLGERSVASPIGAAEFRWRVLPNKPMKLTVAFGPRSLSAGRYADDDRPTRVRPHEP